MKRIYIDPYSVENGLSIAYQTALAADATFIPGQPMGWCAIDTEKDLETIKELLRGEGLKIRVEGEESFML